MNSLARASDPFPTDRIFGGVVEHPNPPAIRIVVRPLYERDGGPNPPPHAALGMLHAVPDDLANATWEDAEWR